ncbi:MAG: hypothetical protein WC563_15385 [Brevundimonas sp.]
MAITSTTRDVRYPAPGDKVTLNCVYTVGNRFRTKLTNKPIDSALETYEAAKENYLVGNTITPDVVGCYTVTFVEETSTIPVPHFSNDTGAGQCVEVVTAVATSAHAITVAGKVKRQIGFAPDDVTLELYATVDDFAGGTTGGALTRYTDATRSPRLTNPGGDAAKIAMATDYVARHVAEIGGYGNETALSTVKSYKYGDRTDQIAPVMSYLRIEDATILESFAWTIVRLNEHTQNVGIAVHNVIDAANVITSPVGVVGDEPSQRILLNETLVDLAAHAAIGGGGAHANADTVCTGWCALYAPLPNPSTVQERIDRTLVLFDLMDEHMTRTQILVTAQVPYVHRDAADEHLDYDAYYPPHDETTAVACMNHMRTRFGCTGAPAATEHLGRAVITAAYHNIPGGWDSYYGDTMPSDSAGLIVGVRKALQVFQAHVTNIEFTSGVTVLYHAAAGGVTATPDWGSRSDVIPGPSDYVGAINALEALNWLLALHSNNGTPTHSMRYQGVWKKRARGIEAIHHAFRTAVTYTGTTVGAAENAAYARLIVGGGFSKG